MKQFQRIFISDILNYLRDIKEEFQFIGNEKEVIEGYSSIYEYKGNTITWLRSEKNFEEVKENIVFPIKFIVLPKEYLNFGYFTNYIKTDDPHRIFFKILEEFYVEKKQSLIGKNNIISSETKIAGDVYIGNNCTIEYGVEIDSGTRIYNNVTLAENVKIGKGCIIKSGAVIGESGHGYVKEKDGKYTRVPHLGSVIIGNYVDIGASTTIERGTMENTIIEDGVKIDDLCQISHNTYIGENTMIIVHSAIYGSARIGKNCWIASSIIKNQVKIGDNVTVGMGSVVTKDIQSNTTVFGIPAKAR